MNRDDRLAAFVQSGAQIILLHQSLVEARKRIDSIFNPGDPQGDAWKAKLDRLTLDAHAEMMRCADMFFTP